MNRLFMCVCIPAAVVCFSGLLRGEEHGTPEQIRFFESEIRPVLIRECYECHSAASGKSEGNLRVDSRDAIRHGGDRGAAVVPGAPKESLLLTAIQHTDPDLRMPPRKKMLAPETIRLITQWIEDGAIDPRDHADTATETGDLVARRKSHWAYQPPQTGELPDVQNPEWCISEIDRYILNGIESQGLSPARDADPATLIRRLTYDLTGLPPVPESLRRFQTSVASYGVELAIAQETDRLIATPQFAERWGRHWLDVARYAESSGKEANISFPYAWRYRDYVIDAVHGDIPYNRFLLEQIAGDLLPADSDQERARLLIATGFLAIGTKNLDEGNEQQFAADVTDEQIDTLSRSLLASSIACARCHDHKSDPFTMSDYYAFAGIFSSSKTWFGTAVSPSNRVAGDPLILPEGPWTPVFHKATTADHIQALSKELETLTEEKKTKTDAVFKAIAEGRNPGDLFTIRDALRIFWRSGAIEGELEKYDATGKPLALGMGVTDKSQPEDARILLRGEVLRPGETVRRNVPEIFRTGVVGGGLPSLEIPAQQSGRLQLAEWLTNDRHPLTGRVFVNRVWSHVFGNGLVRTVDNFGPAGHRPEHIQLLDYLTVKFIEDGWSLKKLVRALVTTHAYRQSSEWRPEIHERDPENLWYARFPSRRLEAEAIRDAMLAVSGELQQTRPVGSLVGIQIGDRPISLIGLDERIPKDLDGSTHRSIYLPVIRNRLPEVLDVFDFPEPSMVAGVREVTNVPTQSLYMLNSSFVQARAEALALRVKAETSDEEQQIRLAFEMCFSRPALPDEHSRLLTFLRPEEDLANDRDTEHDQPEHTKPEHVKDLQHGRLVTLCAALFCTAEFRILN
ncbi:MAG: PSD1 domain-containing protein [Planctomyces sp.]|nr:PSD1 domain-containing protein [Planctomyces sp.]